MATIGGVFCFAQPFSPTVGGSHITRKPEEQNPGEHRQYQKKLSHVITPPICMSGSQHQKNGLDAVLITFVGRFAEKMIVVA